MRGSKPRMNTAISFVERLNGFSAQGQESFIRRQGHGSVLRAMTLPSTTEETQVAEINAVRSKARLDNRACASPDPRRQLPLPEPAFLRVVVDVQRADRPFPR